MEIAVICPICKTRHRVEARHEWPKVDGRRSLELVLTQQSLNSDGGKLEALCPTADDGQQLEATAEWIGDGQVLVKIRRIPRKDVAGQAAAKAQSPAKKSRADMETEAAEGGVKVNPRWTDQQLAVELAKHREDVPA